jgi:hypothetical protein
MLSFNTSSKNIKNLYNLLCKEGTSLRSRWRFIRSQSLLEDAFT